MEKTRITLLGIVVLVGAVAFAAADPPAGPPGDRPAGPRNIDARRGGPPRGDGPMRRDGPRPPAPPLVRALDADKDGKISAAEIENAAAALKTLDKNGDGTLSRDELRPEHPRDRRRGFDGPEARDRPDRPGPRGEAGERPERPRHPIDRAGDGPARDRDAAKGPARGGKGRDPAAFVNRIFESDTNDDGKLTREEFTERGKRMFDHADTNNDGAVDRAELEAAIRKKHQRQHQRRGPRGRDREGGGDRQPPKRPERPDET